MTDDKCRQYLLISPLKITEDASEVAHDGQLLRRKDLRSYRFDKPFYQLEAAHPECPNDLNES